MPKRVGIDLRCLPEDGSGGAGVAHASRELWPTLVDAAGPFDIALSAFVPRGARIDEQGTIIRINGTGGGAMRQALRQHPMDAVFVAAGAVPLGLTVLAYPWVHDLAIFDHPEWFPQSWVKRQLTTRLFLDGLRRAPVIFAVSEDTKRTVEHVARIAPEKICVTSEGVRPKAMQQPVEEYVLLFGTIEPRKNIPFIVALWPEVCRRVGRTVKLVIAGKEGWGNVTIDKTIPGLVRMDHVSDQQHDDLIGRATIVLVPSLHEGYGRTALEAMSFGIPTIVSDRGALPEIVGEAGLVIPLEQPEAWVQNIVSILKNKEMTGRLRQQERERANRFTWDRTARIILAKMAVG